MLVQDLSVGISVPKAEVSEQGCREESKVSFFGTKVGKFTMCLLGPKMCPSQSPAAILSPLMPQFALYVPYSAIYVPFSPLYVLFSTNIMRYLILNALLALCLSSSNLYVPFSQYLAYNFQPSQFLLSNAA